MIGKVFTDSSFLRLDSRVQLAVIYLASIGVTDIDYNVIKSHSKIMASIAKKDESNDLELEAFYKDILEQTCAAKYKIKKNQIEFIAPSVEEILDYVVSNTEKLKDAKTIAEITDDINNFWNYYESVSWCVGANKKKMTNWKTAIIRWLNSDWNKKKKSSGMDESVKAIMMLKGKTN
jgi:hypothetical protein